MNQVWLSLDNMFKEKLRKYGNNNEETKFKEYAKAVGFNKKHIPLLWTTLNDSNNDINIKRKLSTIKNETDMIIEPPKKKIKMDTTLKNEKMEPKSEDENNDDSDVDSIFDEPINDDNNCGSNDSGSCNEMPFMPHVDGVENDVYSIAPYYYFHNNSTTIQMARVLPLQKNVNNTAHKTGTNYGNNCSDNTCIRNNSNDNSRGNGRNKRCRILRKDERKRLRLTECSCETKGRGHRAICNHIFDTINNINTDHNHLVTLKYNELKNASSFNNLPKNVSESNKKKLSSLFKNLTSTPTNNKRKTPVVFGYGYAKMCKNGLLNNYKSTKNNNK